MQEIRRARLQAVIQEELSVMVRDVKDPRVGLVSFTAVEVTQDGEQATLYVSLLGNANLPENEAAKRMKESIAGLTSAAGYLRRQLARVLNVRHVPTLIFKEDRGLRNAERVQELLKQLKPGEGS